MTKKYFLIFVSLLSLTYSKAQNMVNNESFEQYVSCPTDQGQFGVLNWNVTPNSPYSSPDYFNTCATPGANSQSVPDNISGSQTAYQGNGYAGIFCYGNNSEQREYVQTQLVSPMIPGHVYAVSFWVSLADRHKYSIASLGAKITQNQLSGTGGMLILETPQIVSTTSISNFNGWTKVQGNYTALGGEQYLTIGNFFTDENSGAVLSNPDGLFHWSYYYLDMVSVTDSSLGVAEAVFSKSIAIYPNPVKDNVRFEIAGSFEIEDVTLYDVNGLRLDAYFDPVQNSIDVSGLSSGFYQLVFVNSEGIKISKKIIKT